MKKIITMKKLACLFLVSQIFIHTCAFAFVVKRIEIQGLQRIDQATVESYLPIKRGHELTPNNSAAVLRALYKTGFFDHITLSQQGNTMVIHVTERPTIGQLKITGNNVIPTDKLTTVLKTLDVTQGSVYNPSILAKIQQSLLNQYYQLGRYNARVNFTATPMPRNRVLVKIDISEGLVAKIRGISIMGNHVFPEKVLVKQLDVDTTGWFSFYTQTDRYADEKLESSLEKLRSYYMDRGYLRFEVKSAHAQISPDRKSVYINIVISEGVPYTVERYQIAGETIVPEAQLVRYIHIKPGDPFNRQKIFDAEKAISKYLGEKGYLFATVQLLPTVNDQNHSVVLIFKVVPGHKAYVRHITFTDNMRTNDIVLRREIQQLESAPASGPRLEESKHRLTMLPYIKNVDMSINPVPNVPDQVDVNYKVVEDNSAQASFKVGYSQLYGVVIGAGLNQKNFFGTGNIMGINFQRNKVEQFYSMDYTNPYYTEDGISRTFNFSISRTDPGNTANVNSSYTANEYDFGVLYSIPIGLDNSVYKRIIGGVTYQNTLINLNSRNPNLISNQVATFVANHGRRFQEADFKVGFTRDSRDRAVFPTSGSIHTLFLDLVAPLDSNSLSFYIANYSSKWYLPITDQFIFLTKANLGYGNAFHGGERNFPFFRNYFAGGIDTVRGYQGYTLGPRDSNGKAFGGNILGTASAALIFPNFISDNLRTSVFFDAGNVYGTWDNRAFGGLSTNSGPIRYSFGLEADMLTPFGPVEISVAKAINPRPGHGNIAGDITEVFQFAMGANF